MGIFGRGEPIIKEYECNGRKYYLSTLNRKQMKQFKRAMEGQLACMRANNYPGFLASLADVVAILLSVKREEGLDLPFRFIVEVISDLHNMGVGGR
jgi:hypothetical protein